MKDNKCECSFKEGIHFLIVVKYTLNKFTIFIIFKYPVLWHCMQSREFILN
jgi:hypothetical protein